MSKTLRDRLPPVVLGLALLLVWQLASDAAGVEALFPGPIAIIKRTWALRGSLFAVHLPATLSTILTGWSAAIVVGVLLAVLMERSAHVQALLYPLLVTTQTVPVMCITPLFVLWFGYTLSARVLAVLLSTFFSITLTVYQGMHSVPSEQRELFASLGASRMQTFTRLTLPWALPSFFTGLKMTLPWAVIDAAVAEWLGATEGLGYFSRRMATKLDGPAVFAPVVILCALCLAGLFLLGRLERRFACYRSELGQG